MPTTILKIEPYARLITMLGDQLIKNETIALIELIKNSYDADASWVKVNFVNFGDDFSLTPSSKIIIEDDGCGMDEEILKKHWANHGTPEKLNRKLESPRTQKGRILQGEKGIGRFAVFKLGKSIKIISRRQMQVDGKFIPQGEEQENILIYDFSKYDDDFLCEGGERKDIFLKNLQIELTVQKPEKITSDTNRPPHGTIIEISALKSKWSYSKIGRIQQEVGKLQPIFKLFEHDDYGEFDSQKDFSVRMYINGVSTPIQNAYKDKLINCLRNKAVFKIEGGKFSATNNEFSFMLNGEKRTIDFANQELIGLKEFQINFPEGYKHQTSCGDFQYEFYIFDLKAKNSSPYALDGDERKIIKDHRIYLYRDDIRVMPYGDTDDDWLELDMARGTIKSSEFLSNDQVVGCVYISQQDNPSLKDKTNREGLIEMGQAYTDFKHILQLFLRFARVKLYKGYLQRKYDEEKKGKLDKREVVGLFNRLKKEIIPISGAADLVEKMEKAYQKEVDIFSNRLERVENLAAVGLSVETASHDVMLLIRKVVDQIDSVIVELKIRKYKEDKNILQQLKTMQNYIGVIELQLKDIRMLFPSAKKRTKQVFVEEIVDKVYRLYKRALDKNNVIFNVSPVGESLAVQATDAVLLQVCVNLFDNALYWLKTDVDAHAKMINVVIDGNTKRMIFSDNGPGVNEGDKPYIFDAFYSGKGEEGKGLGLYIAKQLLERYDYIIKLADVEDDQKLKGANFVIEFSKEGEVDG